MLAAPREQSGAVVAEADQPCITTSNRVEDGVRAVEEEEEEEEQGSCQLQHAVLYGSCACVVYFISDCRTALLFFASVQSAPARHVYVCGCKGDIGARWLKLQSMSDIKDRRQSNDIAGAENRGRDAVGLRVLCHLRDHA